MIVVNPSTRQFNIPGADMVFGVEADARAETKEFQAPRYVGNNLDLAGSFIRINYRNANGEVDSYLVSDVAVDGENVVFTWELTPKVTMYKGQVGFVMCVTGPDTKVKWHTTLGRGQVLEGLEPDATLIEAGTADVVAQLITMVEAQTEAVETVGETWVKNVKSEGATQVTAVKSAAETAEAAAVAEIEAKGVNTRATIPEDYAALQNAVDALNRSRGPVIVCEAAGESVMIGDSSNLPIQGLQVFGKTTQITTTGAQLIPFPYFNGNKTYNGITWAINSDGSVKATGTATATSPLYFTNSAHELTPGEYTISGSTEGVTVRIDSSVRETGKWKAGVAISKNGQPVTFTITAEDAAAYLYTIYASVEIDNTVNVTIRPMLNSGPTALPWEIYTGGRPSPSPDYPQEINSVENASVVVYGKNLLKPKARTETINGVTFVVSEDGTVIANGTATKATFLGFGPDMALKPGESYILSGSPEGGGFDTYMLYLHYKESGLDVYNRTGETKFTARNEGFSSVVVIYEGVTVNNLVFRPMIRLASIENGDFETYTDQAVTIPHALPGIPVTSGGNYTDADGQEWICDEVDLKRGVYVQRFKVVTLTGDENWVQDTNYSCTYRVGAGHIAIGGISTHYHTYVRTEDIGSVSGVYLAYTVNHIITDPRFINDLAGFKAFLANEYSSGKPVTVIRRLAEPVETPLSETEIAAYRDLHSNYPNTTVLNDSGAHMVVKYAADTKLYIDNKIKEALQ